MTGRARIAALWRGDPATPAAQTRNHGRLAPIFGALAEVGLVVEPVLYDDEIADTMVEHLAGSMWCSSGSIRSAAPLIALLDGVLRDVASRGVWVSAHPDTVMKMGTKEVLYRTRSLGWGADTHLYSSVEAFRSRFPASIAAGRPRVLKQNRGNGGIGVWKVTPLTTDGDLVRGTARSAARRRNRRCRARRVHGSL
jgi:hypothetical protein